MPASREQSRILRFGRRVVDPALAEQLESLGFQQMETGFPTLSRSARWDDVSGTENQQASSREGFGCELFIIVPLTCPSGTFAAGEKKLNCHFAIAGWGSAQL
jgi:hypothetical protein